MDKKLNDKILICGPCAVESKEQLLNIAKELKENNINCLFRAGVWKPRTNPGNFEGLGEIAINWMCEIRRIYGFQIGWEVATEEHIEISLKYQPDFLWIGARTTVNPFMVEKIAKSLANTDISIFVKNPSNSDFSLWCGAIERLLYRNVNVVGVIHRGFSSQNLADYRNAPMWSIPIKLKNKFPNLLLLGDPSHMGGHDFLIKEISQKMMNLNYDGLMVEVHNNPQEAWTDAKQQITPKDLKDILEQLEIPNENSNNNLVEYRMQIDEIDDQILSLIKQRFNITKMVGEWKKKNNVSVFQQNRYDEILKKNEIRSKRYNIELDLINNIFNIIHEKSVEQQLETNEEK